MPGLRLRHPTEKNKTLIVPHPGGGEVNPRPKDYHIRLDGEGFTIVSEVVYKGLQECEAFGYDHQLVFVNEVDNPPTQGVGIGGAPPESVPDFRRVGTTREGMPSSIEKMKRSGIIPEGVTARVYEMPTEKDN